MLITMMIAVVMNQFSVCDISQNLRTNSAPIPHQSAMKLHGDA